MADRTLTTILASALALAGCAAHAETIHRHAIWYVIVDHSEDGDNGCKQLGRVSPAMMGREIDTPEDARQWFVQSGFAKVGPLALLPEMPDNAEYFPVTIDGKTKRIMFFTGNLACQTAVASIREPEAAPAPQPPQPRPSPAAPSVADRWQDPPGGVPLPRYDVEHSCRAYGGTPNSYFPSGSPSYNNCRNEEQAAYDSLQVLWPELHMGKATCVQQNIAYAHMWGVSFYQTLEQCAVQMLSVQQEIDTTTHSQPFHY
jgi:hypothetical protein